MNEKLDPCRDDGHDPELVFLGGEYFRAICPECGESYSDRGKEATIDGWNSFYGENYLV
jgi:hypothetical protein